MNTVSFVSCSNARECSDNRLIKDDIPLYVSGRRSAWKEELLKVLSQYCGCSFVVERSRRTTKYYLVGKIDNISTTKSLWHWLSEKIHYYAITAGRGCGQVAINSYCLGVIDGLKQTIQSSSDVMNFQETQQYLSLTDEDFRSNNNCSSKCQIDEVAFECGKMRGTSIKFVKTNDQTASNA